MMRKLKIEELNRLEIIDFKNSQKFPVSVVLDNVRSMNNIGSIFRTSDVFKIDTLYLGGISAKPPHREINKTAIGATDSVKWVYHEKIEDLLQKLKEQNYIILAIEQTNQSIPLQTYTFEKDKNYAFVFGNEFSGIQESVLNFVDHAIEIPQFGTKHSLNISICVGIVLWHYVYNRLI